MQPHPLKRNLTELSLIRSTGAAADELSFYGPLSSLLNPADDPGTASGAECTMPEGRLGRGAGAKDGGR